MLHMVIANAGSEEFSETADGRTYSVKGVLQQEGFKNPSTGPGRKSTDQWGAF